MASMAEHNQRIFQNKATVQTIGLQIIISDCKILSVKSKYYDNEEDNRVRITTSFDKVDSAAIISSPINSSSRPS